MPDAGGEVRPILLVEDDNDTREVLSVALEAAGYPAVGVRTAVEALTVLHEKQVRPSLILLDLFLPGMSGWQFREAQCEDTELAAIPVIVVSGYPHTLDTIQRGGMRAASAFQKPVDPNALLAAVRQYARRSPLGAP